MARLPVKELTITLHVLDELPSCEANLLEIAVTVLLVKSKNTLVPLDERNWPSVVDRELKLNQDFLFKVDDVLLDDTLLLD